MNTRTTLFGFAACTLVACGGGDSGRSGAKVSEVNWTLTSSGTTTVGHIEVGYDGDQIKDVTFRENGAPAGSLEFEYDGGKVKAIDATDVDGDRGTYTWSYDDDRLSKVVWKVTDVVTDEQKFSYDDDEGGRAKRVTSTTSWAGAAPTTSTVTYDYDEDGRLASMDGGEGDSTWSQELEYDDESRVERITLTSGGTVFDETEVEYDDEGRVESIDANGDVRYDVTYDDDGRIDEIEVVSTGETLTIRYEYESGGVDGLTFAPNLPVAGLVDLEGKTYAAADFLSLAAPLQLGDVPALQVASCDHDVCEAGGALGTSCDSCAASVCAQDSFCCTSSWDSQCVATAESVCGIDCGGGTATCNHDVCTAGDALAQTCDACTQALCASDSYCCTSSWDSTCVGEVATYCGFSC